MGETEMVIGVYKPDTFCWASSNPVFGFHGYATTFTDRYADYIYADRMLDKYRYKRALMKLELGKKVKYIRSLTKLDDMCDAVVCFNISEYVDELKDYNGIKILHTTDYYINPEKNSKILKEIGADYLIAHAQLDEISPFFRKYYKDYIGKTISLPFGYAKRFTNQLDFDKRIVKAVGLGSIHPMQGTLTNRSDLYAWIDYNKGIDFQHPLRYHLATNKESYSDCIDSLFPDLVKQEDFSYDAVEMLNKYCMFINDEGVSKFPPSRTFEGIACGCVMVADNSRTFTDIGFIPDINYIAFDEGDYDQMRCKILYYMNHFDELKIIQKKSLELAKLFSHEEVAKILYDAIKKLKKDM